MTAPTCFLLTRRPPPIVGPSLPATVRTFKYQAVTRNGVACSRKSNWKESQWISDNIATTVIWCLMQCCLWSWDGILWPSGTSPKCTHTLQIHNPKQYFTRTSLIPSICSSPDLYSVTARSAQGNKPPRFHGNMGLLLSCLHRWALGSWLRYAGMDQSVSWTSPSWRRQPIFIHSAGSRSALKTKRIVWLSMWIMVQDWISNHDSHDGNHCLFKLFDLFFRG